MQNPISWGRLPIKLLVKLPYGVLLALGFPCTICTFIANFKATRSSAALAHTFLRGTRQRFELLKPRFTLILFADRASAFKGVISTDSFFVGFNISLARLVLALLG